MTVTPDYRLTHLDILESEALHIFREVAAEFEKPAILFSGGKDSIVMLRVAQKAFAPAKIPFPAVHVDTGHNFSEVIDFRDQRAEELGLRLIVGSVQDAIDAGRLVEPRGPRASRRGSPGPASRGAVRRRAPRRGEGPRQGAHPVVPRRVRPVGPEGPATGAVEPLQHPGAPG